MMEQTTMQQASEWQQYLELLRQFYEIVRTFRIEITLTLLPVLNPLLTFIGVQGVKNKAPAVLAMLGRGRRLTDGEVILCAYLISCALTWIAWQAFIPDVRGMVILAFGVLIIFTFERTVNWIMRWSKHRRPGLYAWLKNDRRAAPRETKSPVMQQDDPTEYFGAGDNEDKTERRGDP